MATTKGTNVNGKITVDPGTVVILDGVVLDMIKNDPGFAASLKQAKLLSPRGFETGNNFYNSPDPTSIATRTETILNRAEAIAKSDSVPFEQAVNKALDENMTSTLEAAGLKDQLGTVEHVDPVTHPELKTAADIAGQLNDNGGVTAQQVADTLKKFPEEDRALLRELLAHQAEIFSSRRQAQVMDKQADHMLDIAAQKGVPKEDVYYFIDEEKKSYGMLAMAHRQATGTPPDHYINGAADLKARKIPNSKMLVILDDVAGSGSSLSIAMTNARSAGFTGEIVISPMVSTEAAPGLLKNGGGGHTPMDPAHTTFAPEAYANALRESAWYKSLPGPKQTHLEALIQGLGFTDNGLSMAFPYMSPDNNNLFFAGTMAENFIVNKNGDAAKNKKQYQP